MFLFFTYIYTKKIMNTKYKYFLTLIIVSNVCTILGALFKILHFDKMLSNSLMISGLAIFTISFVALLNRRVKK